jgi:hypothetical protein
MAGEDAPAAATPAPGPAAAAPAEAAAGRAESAAAPDEAFEAKVLRSFFRDGRLVSIPAQDRKKLVVLRHLRELCFPEDRIYLEKEVNQRPGGLPPDDPRVGRVPADVTAARPR